ncbi:MAG: hypothetical protein DHS20C16_20360 [Phycisphaerae bacterium]|nr:MAG: hypothetical protein DHS20C16_20360 [Phycisphaerae bacterium]
MNNILNVRSIIVFTAIISLAIFSGCRKDEPKQATDTVKIKSAAVTESTTALGPESSPVEPTLDQGWCGGHGVPESVCTRCNGTLTEAFKSAGDWCAEHELPESQCFTCNPEVEAKWRKLDPSAAPDEHDDDTGSTIEPDADGLLLERSPRLLTGNTDPLCKVDTLRVRFMDPTIVTKAGIEVVRVERRSMTATIEVPAEVEFDATRVTRVTPMLSGVTRKISAILGQQVEANDLLATIDSPALGEAKSDYIEREQNLKLAQADLARVNTIHRGTQKMLEVCTPEAKPEDIRNLLAELPVGDAKARLLRAHAALQLSRLDAARSATLHDKKINSEREFQAAQSALAAAEADFIATREEVGFDIEQLQLTALRAVEVARGALESAERRLHIFGLSKEQIAAIGTEPNGLLSRFELRSSVSGRVIERAVSAGESVGADDVLFVVADASTMWLIANVYERDLRQLRTGLPIQFTVDGMAGASFGGQVSWISSQVDDQTRTVRLRADVPNPEGLLKAKMFGTARIAIHENEAVVGVPDEAVQSDGCCQLVFVEESETVFQPRKVVLGSHANGFVEVLKGLDEGERVANAGSFLMKTEILKSSIGAGCCEVDSGR